MLRKVVIGAALGMATSGVPCGLFLAFTKGPAWGALFWLASAVGTVIFCLVMRQPEASDV